LRTAGNGKLLPRRGEDFKIEGVMYKVLEDTLPVSEKLSELTDWQFRVWALGLSQTDVCGRICVSLKKFRAKALPMMSDRADADVQGALDTLIKAELIHPYEVSGRRYAVWHHHEKHNKAMSNLKYARTDCPSPPSGLCACVSYLAAESPPTPPRDTTVGVNVNIDRSIDRSIDRKNGKNGEKTETTTVPTAVDTAVPTVDAPQDEQMSEPLKRFIRPRTGKL